MKLKWIKIVIEMSCMLFLLGGCSKAKSKVVIPQNGVEQVMEDQIAKTEEIDDVKGIEEEERIENEPEKIASTDTSSEENKIDYDLTEMGSDMVYATVYGMMVDSKTYIGKRIKMRGQYYASYYEPTGKYYHYVIVSDAAACCAQGIEFIWDDGSHIYPDEYPADKAEVEVEGVFETYREEGNDSLYCRLKDASLKVIEAN